MNASLRQVIQAVVPSRLFGWVRLKRLRSRRQNFGVRIVERIYGGVPLKVMLADPVGEDWYDHHWDALPEIELLKKHKLKEGARVYDLGAHQGVVALMLAHAVAPTGEVISVEANPFNAGIAEKNKNLNSASRLRILNVAVSDKPGTLSFNEDSNGQVDESGILGRISVNARTIDSLAEEFGNPDVLFLDVEGFECTALRGARKVLASRPDCFVEVHVKTGLETLGGSIAELISFFRPEEFQFFIRGSESQSPFTQVEAAFFAEMHPVLQERFFLVAISKR